MSTRSLRDLPSVDELVRDERLAGEPHELAVGAARSVLERAREDIRAGRDPGEIVESVLAELAEARRPSLRRVLNATGVLVHTNLGRAPLAAAALERVIEVGSGYSNLEYDLARGERGSRQDHLAPLLARLTGAEAALVVNNNAAAVLLALAALAEGREVVVSRGELIEIGDGFRIPDVLARSGARLVEVGTTNRTRAADYERAIGPDTALLLRVHQSNFRVVGFSERPALAEIAEVARAHELPARRRPRLGRARAGRRRADSSRRACALAPTSSRSPATSCSEGRRQVSSSAGGDLVERLRRHPLQRALRADKLTLAALEGTLAMALDGSSGEIPVLRMLHEPIEDVRARAERLAALVGGRGRGDGGPGRRRRAPARRAPERGLCGRGAPRGTASPRRTHPSSRVVRDGRTLLDCRTLTEAEVDEVAAAVLAAR